MLNKVKKNFINYLDIIKTFSGGASVLFGAFLNVDWTMLWQCFCRDKNFVLRICYILVFVFFHCIICNKYCGTN